MLGASSRQHRVRIERRGQPVPDGHGNFQSDYAPFITEMWAAFKPQFGREQVESGAPNTTMIGTMTLLRNPQTAQILGTDRVVFTKGPYAGRIANIRSVIPTPDNAEMEFSLEEGAAT